MPEINETGVENINDVESAADLPEGIVEESDETDLSLDEAMEVLSDDADEQGESTEEEPVQQDDQQPDQPKVKEPGYVRKRIDAAVNKVREEYEPVITSLREQLASLNDRFLKEDARELVRNGEFKSVETAEEYLRMKRGLPAPAIEEPKGQPRNANGQFAPKTDNGTDAATMARIDMLKHQAAAIKERQGVDVIAAFNNDPNVKKRIIAGEADFYDIANEMAKSKRAKPPAPMRSPNGAATTQPGNDLMNMSSEAFKRLEQRIQTGNVRIRQK